MVRFCTVPNCPNKSRNRKPSGVSVFTVPFRNQELLNQWQVALNVKKLGKSDGVCENHFYEEDVKKYCVMKDLKGIVIQTVRYQRPKLAKNCVPKPFDVDCERRKSSYAPDERISLDSEYNEIVCKAEDTSGRGFEIEIKKYGDKSRENSSLVFNTISAQNCLNTLIEPIESPIHIGADEENQKEILYNLLMNGECEVKLPNSSWYSRISKTGILFAYEEEILISVDKSDVIPTQVKRIFLTTNSIKIYFFKKELNLPFAKHPSNLGDLENLIEKVNALRICQGGPFIEDKRKIDLSLAFRDDNTFRWRHKNCSFYLLRSNFKCKQCQDLIRNNEIKQLPQNVKKRPTILGVKRTKS